MEVTRKNFKESLPTILSSIDRADFLVIDTEFTGLMKGKDVSIFDSPMDYYKTTLNGCSDFLLSQFGLCAFSWDDDKKQYVNEAYNFYVFPRGGAGAEKLFLCQSSSLDFLAAQGFDFNKWIREGISYVTEPVEEYLRKKILEKQNNDNGERDFIPVPEENTQQIEDICKRVQQFVKDNDSGEMEIDRCNPFIRRLLFQELGQRFKDDVFLDTKVLENKDRSFYLSGKPRSFDLKLRPSTRDIQETFRRRLALMKVSVLRSKLFCFPDKYIVLVVTRVSSEDDAKKNRMIKEKKEWDDFEDIIGFSKVARMISYSGKLVVGHNMLLDVMHTLNHFFQTLPPQYEQFKEFAHCMFPKILDTKYMSSLPPFKDKVNSNVLQHLYYSLSEEPFSMPTVVSEEGRGYTGADDKNHEAGYDAYVTGVCLIAMHAHLGESQRVSAGSPALQPYLNKLFLARTARQDSPYMNLEGEDPTPSRDHVFHMTFPKEWQRNEINQLFSPYGQVVVQFLDDTTAYVALTNRKRSKEMSKALSGHKKIKLVSFDRHKKIQNKSEDRREWLTSKKTATRTVDSTFRHELPEQDQLKKKVSSPPFSPATQSVPARPAKKNTSPEIDTTDPSPPKKSRLRTISNSKQHSEKKKNDKRKDTSPGEVNEVSEEIAGWEAGNSPETRPEDVFVNKSATQCVSVFKESNSWV